MYAIDATDGNLAWLGYRIASETLMTFQREGILDDVLRLSVLAGIVITCGWLLVRAGVKALQPALGALLVSSFLVYPVTIHRSEMTTYLGQKLGHSTGGAGDTATVPWGLWAITSLTSAFWNSMTVAADRAFTATREREAETSAQFFIGVTRTAIATSPQFGAEERAAIEEFARTCRRELALSYQERTPLAGECLERGRAVDRELEDRWVLPWMPEKAQALWKKFFISLSVRYALLELEADTVVTDDIEEQGLWASVIAPVKERILRIGTVLAGLRAFPGAVMSMVVFMIAGWILTLAASPLILSLFMGFASLITLCAFPLVAFASMIPMVGVRVYLGYLVAFVYIHSWPFFYELVGAISGFGMQVITSGAPTLLREFATNGTGTIIGDALLAARGLTAEVLTGSSTNVVHFMVMTGSIQCGMIVAIPAVAGFLLFGVGRRIMSLGVAGRESVESVHVIRDVVTRETRGQAAPSGGAGGVRTVGSARPAGLEFGGPGVAGGSKAKGKTARSASKVRG